MHASRWTTNVVCAGLLGAVLSGCKSREDAFRATRVPVIRFDSALKAADSGFALKAPHDTMTMADILAWARAEQVRKAQVDAAALAAARARQDSMRKVLEPLLTVTVVKKSYLPRNPDSEQYEDYISLAFAYQNRGEKAIRAFQGDATFLDTFGDSIYSAHLKVDLALTPGQTRREPARIVRVNPFRLAHQRLRDTPLDKMKLVWQTSDVVFADGSRLSLSAP